MHKMKKLATGKYLYRGWTLEKIGGAWFAYQDIEHALPHAPTRAKAAAEVDYLLENNYREVTSALDGKTKVMERMDTPFHCSVASEAYWSS